MSYKYCVSYTDHDNREFDRLVNVCDNLQTAMTSLITLYKDNIIKTLREAVDGLDETLITIYEEIMGVTEEDNFNKSDYDETGMVRDEIFDKFMDNTLKKMGFDNLHMHDFPVQKEQQEDFINRNIIPTILRLIDNNIQNQIKTPQRLCHVLIFRLRNIQNC